MKIADVRGRGMRSARRLASGLLALSLVAGTTIGIADRTVAAPVLPRQSPPAPLYGVTLDTVARLPRIVAGVSHLAEKPVVRLYFDVSEPVSYYARAVAALHPHSYLMGELLDSSDERRISVVAFGRRVRAFVAAYGHSIDLWEIGNEVNGNWTGRYSQVSRKLVEAYRIVHAAGGRTALTLYYDVGCGDGPSELGPLAFSRHYVPRFVRGGLDDVFLSYYEDECGNRRPSLATWTEYFRKLHLSYPAAKLGFGEIGLSAPATANTTPTALLLIRHYYGLRIPLPYYAGGYFWWYFAEDCLPYQTSRLWSAIDAGFRSEQAAIARQSSSS